LVLSWVVEHLPGAQRAKDDTEDDAGHGAVTCKAEPRRIVQYNIYRQASFEVDTQQLNGKERYYYH